MRRLSSLFFVLTLSLLAAACVLPTPEVIVVERVVTPISTLATTALGGVFDAEDGKCLEAIPVAIHDTSLEATTDTSSRGRSFSTPGEYWFTPHYSPDGTNWIDITWPDGRTSYVYITVAVPSPTDLIVQSICWSVQSPH